MWVAKVEVRLETAQIHIFERYLALTAKAAFDFKMHLKMWNLTLFDSLACTIVASAFWHCIALWLGLVANEWFYEDTMIMVRSDGLHFCLGGTIWVAQSGLQFNWLSMLCTAATCCTCRCRCSRKHTYMWWGKPQIYDEEYPQKCTWKHTCTMYMMRIASQIWWVKTVMFFRQIHFCLKYLGQKTSIFLGI